MPAIMAATKIGVCGVAEPKRRNGAARTEAGNAPADAEHRSAADQLAIDAPLRRQREFGSKTGAFRLAKISR